MTVMVRNITGQPLRISARLVPVAAELNAVATLRASVAGAVIFRGSIAGTDQWTSPLGLLPSGATSSLRIRFKLKRGTDPDEFAGRLDIRQLELKGTPPGKALVVPSDVQKVVPGTKGAAPVPTSPSGSSTATTPTGGATPTPIGTPVPTSAIPPRSDDAPKRRAPDEGSE